MIKKAKEWMTARERVLRTFHFEAADRVPIDYSANSVIHERLCHALGVDPKNQDALLELLGVDFREIKVPFKGRCAFPVIEGCEVDPVYGFYTRWVENESGGYHDFCHFPLEGAEAETIANFPVPSPDEFDYSQVANQAAKYADYGKYIGNPGIIDIINATGRVMGMEDTLVNLLLEDEATLAYIKRRTDMEYGMLERILSKTGGNIDFMWIGEDLGTQKGPMISLELYRKVIRPIQQKFVDLAKSYNLPVMIHTCGSSSWAYEDFIEMGISAVDTLQPEATDMSPAYLKEKFGGRLSFHGCISTAGPLAYGTVQEVEEECRSTIELMKTTKGYHAAPTHMIQDNTPVANILTMYQAAHTYGRYSE